MGSLRIPRKPTVKPAANETFARVLIMWRACGARAERKKLRKGDKVILVILIFVKEAFSLFAHLAQSASIEAVAQHGGGVAVKVRAQCSSCRARWPEGV